MELISIITSNNRPTEYTGLGNLGFLWIVGAVLLAGYIACFLVGRQIGKAWNSDDPPFAKKVIDSIVKGNAPKLKDPSHYMKGKK